MAKRVGYSPAMTSQQSFGDWYNDNRLLLNPLVTGSVVGLVGVINALTLPLWPHTIVWAGTALFVLLACTVRLNDKLQRAFYRAVLLVGAAWMVALQTPMAAGHWRGFTVWWFCSTIIGAGGYWNDQRVRSKIQIANDLASWPQLSKRIGIPLAWITNKVKTESGYRRRLSWPDGEYTITQIRSLKDKIESALKIPTGQLRFANVTDGDDNGNPNAIDLVVNTASKARKAPVVFGEPTMRSITDEMFVGPYEDGEDCKIHWYEQGFGGTHTLAAGITRSGKALALDTPIATPTGWTTMGELRTGNEVFGDDGQVCQVTFAHPAQADRPCYEVTFSDGERIIADAAHEWWVESRQARLSRFQTRRHDENRARRVALPGHAVDSLRALAAAQSQVSLRDVALAAGLATTPTMLYRTARAVGATGLPGRMRPYRDGTRYKGGIATYPAVELIERYIAVGTKPTGDQRHKRSTAQVLTTREIAETVLTASGHANYSIPLTAPLTLPDAVLPVAPYTLGAWLGDGANRAGRITNADPDVLARIWTDGYQVGPPEPETDSLALTNGVYGLSARLREMGLLAGNGAPSAKHIPTEYLRSSIGQRRELLAGLLDADGTVAPAGTVNFDNTCRRLAGGVLELALSLGYRATMTEKDATLNGQVMGRTWRVAFTTTDPVFGLHRKLEALRERTTHSNTERIRNRYIVSVEPVESRAVRCITVDSPSHLFLAGRSMIPTHNSGLYRLMLGDSAPCDDVIRLGIDAKGGMALRPWSPLFEWLVVGRDGAAMDETRAMLEWLDAVMIYRETYAGQRKWDVWRVSRKHPLIILYVDEAAEVFGMKYENFAAVQLVEKIGRMGAGTGVLLCAATQYPTVEAIASSQIQSQIGRRFCFRVANKQNMHVILPSAGEVDATFPDRPTGSAGAGWCFLSDNGAMKPQPLRVRNLNPERVFEIVSANYHRKGVLDAGSAGVETRNQEYRDRRRWTLDDANPSIDPEAWADEADELAGPPRDDAPPVVTEPALNREGPSVTESVTEGVTEMVTETYDGVPPAVEGLSLDDLVRPRTEADATALAKAQAAFAAAQEEWPTDKAKAMFWATLEVRTGRPSARGPGAKVANLVEACHRKPSQIHEWIHAAVMAGQIERVKEGSHYYRIRDGVTAPDLNPSNSE